MKLKCRYKIIAAALAMTALLAGCGGGAGKSGVSSNGPKAAEKVKISIKPKALRQIVAADNETARTVMFQLPLKMDMTVEFREKGADEVRTVTADVKEHKGTQGVKDDFIYTARLTGLTKGKTYEFRARSGNDGSEWQTMTTDDGGAFTALVFPDSQSADYGGWKYLAQHAYKKFPQAKFFINMGDLVDNGEDEYQWGAWFSSLDGIIDRIPVAPMMGNHEDYSLEWELHKPDHYLAHFDLPANGDSDYQDFWYSFDWGPVHFTVIDTQLRELMDWYPDLFEREKKWLADDLSKTKKKWKVVLMHKDPFQYGFANRPESREEGFSQEGREFMPFFDEAGVDLVLSAHLHTYRDRGRVKDFARDAAGPYYIITGVAGDVRYPGLWKRHTLDEYEAPQPETANYLVMQASDEEITVTGYLPDGTELHKSVVRKGG